MINKKLNRDINDVLEQGCGFGTTLGILRNLKIKAEGFEINKHMIHYGKKKGYKIISQRLPENQKKYDLIIMSETIEHLLNPLEELIKTRNMLEEKGYICITTPDFSNMITKFLLVDEEEHLFYFTKNTLENLLKKSGFQPISIQKFARKTNVLNFTKNNKFSKSNKFISVNKIVMILKKVGLINILNHTLSNHIKYEFFVLAKKREIET